MLTSMLILSTIVILIAIPIALNLWHERKRRRWSAMSRAAEELGFAFLAWDDGVVLSDLSSSYLFSQVRSKTIENVMRRVSDDLEVKIFDFGYTARGEEEWKHAVQTVICFRSRQLDVPAFCVRPKNLLDRIATLFGHQDIAVDGHALFSKTYLLRGRDEAGVRKLFTGDVLTYYERSTCLFTEGVGNQLMFYRWGKRVDPDQIRFFVQEGFEVLSLFWQASAGRRQELADDFSKRFGVRVAGDVGTAANRHPAGIRQAGQ
jgi:hypothetical protein